MKKFLIGMLSALLLMASIFGASSKAPRDRRSGRPANGSDHALWV